MSSRCTGEAGVERNQRSAEILGEGDVDRVIRGEVRPQRDDTPQQRAMRMAFKWQPEVRIEKAAGQTRGRGAPP